MNLTTDDVWVMIVGGLVNVSCGLLGCYLVLRRLSLLGDAISHAVLPGIVLAFMLTNSRAILPMFVGAMVVGVLTAFLSESIHRVAKVPQDASMGVVFTSLFALGVIMISRVARDVDLDPNCVLYGLIEFVAFDMRTHFGLEAPRTAWALAAVTLVVIGFIVLLYKELKIVSFDPQLSDTLGIRAWVVHYLLMAMVAGTTVASFEAVGSILVVAMLIVPGATAHLLTDRLDRMLWIAAGTGIVSAVLGTLAAIRVNTSVAGMMSLVAGGQFMLALVLAPRYGLLSRWLHQWSVALRVVCDDVLARVYRWRESHGGQCLSAAQAVAFAGGGLMPRMALWRLRQARLVHSGPDGLTLSQAGHRKAGELVRAHRLWESFLAEHSNLPLDHLHGPAERVEHFVSPSMREQIARDVKDPVQDPHGRPIPDAGIPRTAASGDS